MNLKGQGEELHYEIKGELHFGSVAKAKKAKVFLLAKGGGPLEYRKAFKWKKQEAVIDYRCALNTGSAWGLTVRGLRSFAALAETGELIVSLLEDTKTIRAGGSATMRITSLPAKAVRRFGDLSLRHPCAITAVAFSPDGRLLATGSGSSQDVSNYSGDNLHRMTSWASHGSKHEQFYAEGDLRLWDVDTGELLWGFLGAHKEVESIRFSPDGTKLFAIAAQDAGFPTRFGKTSSVIVFVDLSTGFEKKLAGASIYNAAFSADGTLLVVASEKGLTLWSTDKMKKILSDAEPCVGAAISSDNKCVYAASKWGYLRCLDATSGNELQSRRITEELEAPVDILLREDEGTAIALDRFGARLVVDLESFETRDTPAEVKGLPRAPTFFAPKGGRFAAVDSSKVHCSTSEGETRCWEHGAQHIIPVAALSYDGSALALGSRGERSVQLLDPKTGKPLSRGGGLSWGGRERRSTPIHSLRFGTSETLALRKEALVEIVDCGSGNSSWSHDVQKGPRDRLTFSATGRHLAVDSPKGMQMFDLASGSTESIEVEPPMAVSFDREGKRLLVLCNGCLTIIELSTMGRCSVDLPIHPGAQNGEICWLDGQRVMIALEQSRGVLVDLGAKTSIGNFDHSFWFAAPAGNDRVRSLTPEGEVIVTDLDSGEAQAIYQLDMSQFRPKSVSRDGRFLAATWGHALRVWDYASGDRVFTSIGHLSKIMGLDFVQYGDETKLATGGEEGLIVLWSVNTE